MALWYCHIDGIQYGPVNENEFRAWIAEGRVRPENHVWCEGMANWVYLAQLPHMMPPGYVAYYSTSKMPPSHGGTGGKASNAHIMVKARTSLQRRWGLAMAFCVLLGLLNFAAAMVPFAGVVTLVVAGPFELGNVSFFLIFTRRRSSPQLGLLFKGFKSFGRAVVAYLLIKVFTILRGIAGLIPISMVIIAVLAEWIDIYTCLKLCVPTALIAWAALTVAGLRYAQAFYVMAENADADPLEAIRKSRELMRGKQLKLLYLYLRFTGWFILSISSIGIGFLWFLPYFRASLAMFHDDLYPPAVTVGISQTVTIDPTQIRPAETTSTPHNDTFGGDLTDQS